VVRVDVTALRQGRRRLGRDGAALISRERRPGAPPATPDRWSQWNLPCRHYWSAGLELDDQAV
jgi:hypothetical protein